MPNACGTTLPVAVTVPSAPNQYPSFSFSGTFAYCNNPERIYATSLGDSTGANKYLLSTNLTGDCLAYYEHTNYTGGSMGYGLQLYNPNSFPVTVSVTNIGFSMTNMLTVWDKYFSGASGCGGTVFSNVQIPAYGSKWIQRNDPQTTLNGSVAIPASTVFNGAVRFTVSGGSVYLFNYAYQNFANLNGTATYVGYITTNDGQDESRVYKGVSTGSGCGWLATSSLNGGANLNLSTLVGKPAFTWMSHWCQNKAPIDPNTGKPYTYGYDIVPITTTEGTIQTFSCGNLSNLGNWGVPERYTVNLYNDTGATRTVYFAVAQKNTGAASNVYVTTPGGTGGCTLSNQTWMFYNVTMTAGQTLSVTYQVILGGNSSGGLMNYIGAA